MGKLDGVVAPVGWALQERSRGKFDFLRLGEGLWERFSAERRRTGELAAQVAAAQQVIDDLRRRKQAAQDELQAVVEQARLDRVDFQATVEKARLDAAELVRVKGEREALQKTVERIRHKRQNGWQDRDLEAAWRVEAEKMVADLGTEVGELQTAVAQGLDRERELRAQSEDELARLREALDAERVEHSSLRDAVRAICDGLGVVQGEGTSSLAARALGVYRRAREIAWEALHVGVKRAFGVFGSHYTGLNFVAMSGGYAAGYSDAELDDIDASVLNPAETLAKLLEDEAVPLEDPGSS